MLLLKTNDLRTSLLLIAKDRLGDGRLNYGRENIIEWYYSAHAWRGAYLGLGLQYITNPGYNRDRGPVLIPGFRLHLEF